MDSQRYIDHYTGADYGRGTFLAGRDGIPLILLDGDACSGDRCLCEWC